MSAWLTRNVRVLSGVSLLQDAASELLYPVLPLFLVGTLGAPVAVVGIVEGAAEGAAALTKLVAGRLADRQSRKPLIALGYGVAALGKLVVAVALVWPVVLLGRVVDRLGKGVRGAPRDVLLMVDVDPAVRGRVFGFHRAMDTAGAVIGPLAGLALYSLLGHRIRPLLWVAVLPAVLSVALVACVREGPVPHGPRASGPAVALPGRLKVLIAVLTGFSLVNFPDALLLLRGSELGLSTEGVIGAYVVYNVVYAALSYPAGALSDRFPRHVVYAVGLIAFAVGYLGLAVAPSAGWVFVVLPLYGGFAACTDGVGKAWVASAAAAGGQGRAQGLYQGLQGGAVLVAGVWAGLAWQGTGVLPLMVAGSVGLVLALVLLAVGDRLAVPPRPLPLPA